MDFALVIFIIGLIWVGVSLTIVILVIKGFCKLYHRVVDGKI
jgi:hypothetical protein